MFPHRKILLFSIIVSLSIILSCSIPFKDREIDREATERAILKSTSQAFMDQTKSAAKEDEGEALDMQEPGDKEPEGALGSTITPGNCNRASFVSENVPDGTSFSPGYTFLKTWRIRNDGTCTWTSDYKIVFKSGNRMGGISSQNISGNIKPGEALEISTDLTAPDQAGDYSGEWNLKSPDGEFFARFWANIKVDFVIPPAQILPDGPLPPIEQFKVVQVNMSMADDTLVGPCPMIFAVNLEYKANGPGTMQYVATACKIGNSFCAGTPAEYTFLSDEPLLKNWSCHINESGEYEFKIHVIEPNDETFGPLKFDVTCTQ